MLDESGFKRKNFAELKTEMETKAKEVFGENTNLTLKSPLGILIWLFAWFLAKAWELIEKVYNNSFPGTAQGVSLDRSVRFKGITRNSEEYAYGKIKLIGVPGGEKAAGFVLSTKRNFYFETTEDAVLDENGEASVEISAVVAGSQGNVAAGDITEILYPDPDVIYSAINIEPTIGGRDRETDLELYKRYEESPSDSGSSDIEGIKATLLDTPGVRDAIVNQNSTMFERNGIPPKSIAPFVFGGNDLDVAEALFSVASGGIEVFGTTVVEVFDSKGTKHLVGFSRPTQIDVYARVTLTKKANFPTDGPKMVRSEVLKYIGGEDESGTEYLGLGLDEDVIHAKIVAKVFLLDSVEDAVVELSTDGINFSQQNINVNSNQVAKTRFDKVVVT